MASILVVDDRPTNREFLVTLLGHKGHRLLEASDGTEALEGEVAEAQFYRVADHHGAGEDGGGDGSAGDDGEIVQAEMGEGTK